MKMEDLIKITDYGTVEKAKYKVKDMLIEDRRQYIGTPLEHKDKEFPIVRLEILEVYLNKNLYVMYNHTRSVHTLGRIDSVDNSKEINYEV
jgi:hypothetical protein